MLEFLKKLFDRSEPPPPARAAPRALARTKPQPAPRKTGRAAPELDVSIEGGVEETGPGKNVLVRRRFVREDTGTHETLRLVDDSDSETHEEAGIDPYNTGNFDRSKNWDKRFRY